MLAVAEFAQMACTILHSFKGCVVNQNGKLFLWRACLPQLY